jgi:sugar phosphate isomerase/epimerase
MANRSTDRRDFLFSSLAFASTAIAAEEPVLHLRFAHRQANMVTAPGQDVFELARSIPGLSGVELQMIWKGQDLSDPDSALIYKRQATRSGLEVPSIAGVWKAGETIFDTAVAEKALSNAIRMTEYFRAKVILVALFKTNCPDMEDESSFGPVVSLLRRMGQRAADAGVSFGLETSLTPPDEKKLLDLIDSRRVRSYYDATNIEEYHPGQGVAGIELLGPRIVQCHLKNGDRVLDQKPSKVNWVEALKDFNHIGYRGWYVFETRHDNAERCIEDTKANIEFVRSQLKENT